MADNPRIEDLRRRVQKDPASIAFAQLAEEYRRAGLYQEAVDACRTGLATHPAYLSARVTLGRSLIELGQLEEAQQELGIVLKSAPENLAAIRGIADVHYKRGALPEALEFYRTALGLARNDPDLEQTVADLTKQLGPARRPEPKDGLSLDDMHRELKARAAPTPAKPAQAPPTPAKPVLQAPPTPVKPAPATPSPTIMPQAAGPAVPPVAVRPVQAPAVTLASDSISETAGSEEGRAFRSIAALERFLDAIHAARAHGTA